MTFSQHNRKSNIFVLAARGVVGKNQDLEGLDYKQLVGWVTESTKSLPDALSEASVDKLKALYKRCLRKDGKGTTTQ